MRTVADSGGVTLATYDYDQLLRRDFVTFGNGTTTDSVYYSDSALQTLSHGGGGRSAVYSFGRNFVNQITSVGIVAPASGNWNETTFLGKPTVGSNLAFSPDKLNRYATVAGVSQGYDANGNLTTDGIYTFGYDAENRLRTASSAGIAVTYEYDPAGRRRAKMVNGQKTIYLSDGVEEIEERDAGNVMLRRYAYGPGIDDRVAMLDSTLCATRCFYQTNHQGSTIAFSNQSGSLVDAFGYDAYGQSNNPTTGNPFRYTGRRLDPETGLYYYRARYYSPKLGRFLQTDPIGTKDDLNVYAYTYNDPANRTDPNGDQSRVVVDESRHTIHVVVPVSPGPGQSFDRIANAIKNTSQTVVDTKGQSWRVEVSAQRGALVNGNGQAYVNYTVNDPYSNPKEGSREATSSGSGIARLHPEATDKTIAHELVGHGSGLRDEYNPATLQPNPALPHNLMNNDDFSSSGTQINSTQLETITSPSSGNDIVRGELSLWRRFRDWMRL